MNAKSLTRRDFLSNTAIATASLAAVPELSAKQLAPNGKTSESYVKLLHASLSDSQKKVLCFPWDHRDKKNGLLRTHVSNNWRITNHALTSDFYTKEQQLLIRKTWEGLVNPDWVERFDKQFKDDMGGFGKKQGIAIFGDPMTKGENYEFVLTGRHGTVRCDGDSADHMAFGGPIVYGHAASGYYEKAAHPNNVFWHQAVAANDLFEMLDGKQREKALRPEAPEESDIAFRGKDDAIDGIAIESCSSDQKEQAQKVLLSLLEPYRLRDREEALNALKKQGGLDACHLTFYKKDDLGNDGIWDNWRLEGPSFVWHYRGAPHVHVWLNVADTAKVDLNSHNRSGPLRQKS